jgi:ER membrane protein complex subunit 3
MLQSGVATRDLDVRWVSSLSWYFLNLFGLQSVFTFILGNDNAASQMAQQMGQMNMGGGSGGAPQMFGPGADPDKMFKAEAENLEVLEHKWVLEGVEDRLVALLG